MGLLQLLTYLHVQCMLLGWLPDASIPEDYEPTYDDNKNGYEQMRTEHERLRETIHCFCIHYNQYLNWTLVQNN